MADPIARCCLFPGLDQPAATVVDVSIVRPGPEVDRDYLAYAISNPAFRAEALGSASGTTRSRISRSNLGAITVPLPPHDEQRRIAEVLRSVDEAIAASQKVADQALAIWHGLTESLIWQQMVSQPHCAQPLGNALERSDYGVNASLSNEPGGSAVLRMGNLQSGWIDPTDLKWGEIADAEVRSLALDVGDILFNRTNSRDLVGKVALVREPTDFIYASYIVRLRPNHAVADRGGLAKLDSGISGFSA
jgi:type I restriction enzyme S subunit